MKAFANTLLGILCILCVLTVFTSWQLAATLFVFSISLYTFFFKLRLISPGALLFGITVGIELLDNHHFGTASLVAVFLYGLALLFRDLFRFTSEFGRFIVALVLFILVYPLFMLPLGQYFHYLPQSLTALFAAGLIGGFIQHSTRHAEYELI